MRRRWQPVLGLALSLLTACANGSTLTARRAPTPDFGLAARELSTREQALQALNRLAFGPRPGDVERVTAMGVDQWVDRQLHPERINDDGLTRSLSAYPVLDLSMAELMREYPPPGATLVKARVRGDSALTPAERAQARKAAQGSRAFVGELLSAKVARAATSERQLQEVMTDFWSNHFSVYVGKGQIRYALPDYDRDAIRPYALGKFRDLLGAVAKSPAMLFYLDNVQSVADSDRTTAARRGRLNELRPRRRIPNLRPPRGRRPFPANIQDTGASGDTAGLRQRRERLIALAKARPRGLNENYARELLELHTLGVDGGYTQQDVIEVARALTGWTERPPRSGGSGFLFNPAAHDAEPKVILGHHLPGGRGIEDGEDVLDILARHPSTARFIAHKLAVRFVSDTPPGTLVDRAAEAFRRTDGDIREVVRTIVTSPEFYSRAAYRAKVKSPFELVVSAVRAVGASADTTPRTAALIAQLGEPIYGHQAPNGWPETGEAWMNTGAILNRINFGLALAAGRVPGASLRSWPAYASLEGAPADSQVNGVIDALLGGSVSLDTRAILESGRNPMLDRTASDAAGGATFVRAGDDMNTREPAGGPLPRSRARPLTGTLHLTGLSQLVGLALGSPEFQRR